MGLDWKQQGSGGTCPEPKVGGWGSRARPKVGEGGGGARHRPLSLPPLRVILDGQLYSLLIKM